MERLSFTPCIEWQGKQQSGYGKLGRTRSDPIAFAAGVRKKNQAGTMVHRLAMEVTDPLVAVHHMCGNKLCMRRAHLLVLSQIDHQRLHMWMRKS